MSDYGYTDRFLDVTAPMGPVEIEVAVGGSVIWVHTDGRTVLRVCRITDRVIINDHREQTTAEKVLALWNRHDGWIPGSAHAELAEVLGIDGDETLKARQSRPSYTEAPGSY